MCLLARKNLLRTSDRSCTEPPRLIKPLEDRTMLIADTVTGGAHVRAVL